MAKRRGKNYNSALEKVDREKYHYQLLNLMKLLKYHLI